MFAGRTDDALAIIFWMLLICLPLGQAIFNDTLPKGYPFVRGQADKGKLSQIVNKLAEEYPKVEVAASLVHPS